MSKYSQIDPERLAALMEGKLSASEAAAVRAELAAADPETIAGFADAAEVAAELGLLANTPPLGHRRRTSGYRWSFLGLAAAAALGFVALKVIGRRDTIFGASQMVAMLPMTITAPTAEPWSARRGTGDDLAPSVRASRLGVMLVDFELAARAADTAGVRRAAAAIVALTEGAPGATTLAASYRAFGSGDVFPRPTDPARDTLNAALAKLAGSPSVAAGSAGETLRAISTSGDSSAVAQLCSRSAILQRALSVPVAPSDAAMRDSLIGALADAHCDAARIRAFSSAFLSALTR